MAKPYPKSKIVASYKDLTLGNAAIILDDETNWLMKSGEIINIKNLRSQHIKSILEMMNSSHPNWRRNQKPILQEELTRRIHLKIARSGKAGKLLYGKV